MAIRRVETSPQVYARIGGVLYLISIVVGILAELLVKEKLVVSGDPAATAANIMGHELLFRVSATAQVVELMGTLALSVLLYVLLRPVSNTLALMALVFNVVSNVVEAVFRISLFVAVLLLSGGAGYLKAIEASQLQALAYLAIKLDSYGSGVALAFFGCCLFFYGYLVFKSGYFPRTIGVLLIVASLSYLINSCTLFVLPAYASMTFPLLLLAFIGESSFCLWLLVKGVDLQKWPQQLTTGSV
jgi:hypothetical protein